MTITDDNTLGSYLAARRLKTEQVKKENTEHVKNESGQLPTVENYTVVGAHVWDVDVKLSSSKTEKLFVLSNSNIPGADFYNVVQTHLLFLCNSLGLPVRDAKVDSIKYVGFGLGDKQATNYVPVPDLSIPVLDTGIQLSETAVEKIKTMNEAVENMSEEERQKVRNHNSIKEFVKLMKEDGK